MTTATPPAAEKKPVAAAVTLRIAGRPGPTFALDTEGDNVIGRSTDVGITIPDRLASRAHAAIRFHTARHEWILRDVGSRNGTWLNGRRVDFAPITAGGVIRIGTSELVFQELGDDSEPSPAGAAPPRGVRIVRSGPIAQLEAAALRQQAGSHADEAVHPLTLHAACLRLLETLTLEDVCTTVLELVAHHAAATAVGWFRVEQGTALEQVAVVPSGFGLRELVVEPALTAAARDGHVVWLTHESPAPAGSVQGTDVVCTPVHADGRVAAVVVTAIPHGKLRGPDFGFLVALARLTAAACDRVKTAAGAVTVGTNPVPSPPAANHAVDHHTIDLDEHVPAVNATASRIAVEGTVVLGHSDAAIPPAPAVGGTPPAIHLESLLARVPTLKFAAWQRLLIVEALRRHRGNLVDAARDLGVPQERLHEALVRHGLVTHH